MDLASINFHLQSWLQKACTEILILLSALTGAQRCQILSGTKLARTFSLKLISWVFGILEITQSPRCFSGTLLIFIVLYWHCWLKLSCSALWTDVNKPQKGRDPLLIHKNTHQVSKLERKIILKAVIITKCKWDIGCWIIPSQRYFCVDLSADLPLLVPKCDLKSHKEVVQG